MTYTTEDATRVLFRFYAEQGFTEDQIDQPSQYGYMNINGEGRLFVHMVRDDEGLFAFKPNFVVKFLDDYGKAEISFADGTRGVVQIDPI